jgi:hypothetical protein
VRGSHTQENRSSIVSRHVADAASALVALIAKLERDALAAIVTLLNNGG